MNEKRFIELINLQIDGEISPPELDELESEVASDSRRHATYQDYMRLHQASELACNRFGEALAETVDLRKYQILARESHGWRRGFLYSAGALTAACFSVAAAVAVFQDVKWSPPGVSPDASAEVVAVETLQPENQMSARTAVTPRFVVHHRPASERVHVRFLDPLPARQETFAPSGEMPVPPVTWPSEWYSAPSGRVIRGPAGVDHSELVSFEFQR